MTQIIRNYGKISRDRSNFFRQFTGPIKNSGSSRDHSKYSDQFGTMSNILAVHGTEQNVQQFTGPPRFRSPTIHGTNQNSCQFTGPPGNVPAVHGTAQNFWQFTWLPAHCKRLRRQSEAFRCERGTCDLPYLALACRGDKVESDPRADS